MPAYGRLWNGALTRWTDSVAWRPSRSAAEALRELPRRRVHLALVSHTLADKPGTACLAEMKVAAPEVPRAALFGL